MSLKRKQNYKTELKSPQTPADQSHVLTKEGQVELVGSLAQPKWIYRIISRNYTLCSKHQPHISRGLSAEVP